MNLKELENFLCEAHGNTYANKTAQKASSSRLESKDYHFEKNGFTYHDTYFGERNFLGSEIIYKENKPIWGMNYYGYILKSDISEKDVYNFLRQSLMQTCIDIIPARGPSRYKSNLWDYANAVDGNLECFGGTETIFLAGEEIYRCWYHGGLII